MEIRITRVLSSQIADPCAAEPKSNQDQGPKQQVEARVSASPSANNAPSPACGSVWISTQSKRWELNRKAADTPFGRGRSISFFALIGGRNGCPTSSAFRGQFNSRNGNRTRVPGLSAGRTRLLGHCLAGSACRVRPVPGNAASVCCGWPRSA